MRAPYKIYIELFIINICWEYKLLVEKNAEN